MYGYWDAIRSGRNGNCIPHCVTVMTNMRRVTLCFLLASSAFGQTLTVPYSVKGTVRNTVSGEPVRNAQVVLERIPGADLRTDPAAQEFGTPQTKSTMSGAGGEFHFDNLAAGHYSCLARRPDFMTENGSPQNPGTIVVPRPSGDGLVQLKLTPYGAIQGTVVNQFGEPLEYVLVIVRSISTWDGERITSEVARPRTNNLGHFLVTRILPGTYYVKVVGRDGGTETRVGPEKMHYAPWESFAPAYFGGAPERASAAPIEVAAGSLVQTDFRVDLQRAFRIRGKLEGYRPPDSVRFELLHGNEPGEPQRAVLDGVTGEFEILDVLPGAYTLRATQDKTRGEVALTVAGVDLGGISIALAPGVTINGSTHFVAAPGASAVSGGGQFRAACSVDLREHRRRDSEFVGIPEATGQFTMPDVFPGEYRVSIQCNGGYALSASFGNIDLLTNPIITITKDATRPIEIACQPGGGLLKARFAGETPSGRAVLLVPSFPSFAGPVLIGPISATLPKLPGDVMFSGLAPGEYSVYGLSKSEDLDYHSAAFLQSLSGGTTVRIEDGKTTEVAIEKISK